MMNLLRKELSELMNKQMLISLVVSFILITMVGTITTSLLSGEMSSGSILHIIDEDQSSLSESVISLLEENGYSVETGTDFETMVQNEGWEDAVVLPAGMEAAFENHESVELPVYTYLTTTSAVKLSMKANSSDAVTAALKKCLSGKYLEDDLAFLEHPVTLKPYTSANGKTIQADASVVVSSLMMFDQLMPLVLFLLVVLTAQTIITAICSEKLDKTLETLLSSPVPRTQIIGAKMLAALIVAVTYAVVYGLGFLTSALIAANKPGISEEMNLGSALTDMVSAREAVQALGLQMPGYCWIGVLSQLVLTLAIALTASIILGALTEDAKNAQSASLPIMLCTMLPYMLSMVSDIRNMDGGIKWLMMAIPFTHTFIATGCMRFHDYATFWGGMVYQAVFLIILMRFALKLYSSDILFVHSRKHRRKTSD